MNNEILTPEQQREKRNTYARNYYHANKEKRSVYQKKYSATHGHVYSRASKKWRTTHPEKHLMGNRKRSLRRKYGLTIDQMKQMYISQDGVCAICTEKFKNTKNMQVDHNHTTGQVRQLLCGPCNYLIGNAKEDVSIMKRAIDYINFWNTPK